MCRGVGLCRVSVRVRMELILSAIHIVIIGPPILRYRPEGVSDGLRLQWLLLLLMMILGRVGRTECIILCLILCALEELWLDLGRDGRGGLLGMERRRWCVIEAAWTARLLVGLVHEDRGQRRRAGRVVVLVRRGEWGKRPGRARTRARARRSPAGRPVVGLAPALAHPRALECTFGHDNVPHPRQIVHSAKLVKRRLSKVRS